MEHFREYLIIFTIVAVFMMPTIVAFTKGHQHKWAILIANLVIAPAMYPWLAILLAAMYGRRYKR
jgi:uncharacterized membrane protein